MGQHLRRQFVCAAAGHCGGVRQSERQSRFLALAGCRVHSRWFCGGRAVDFGIAGAGVHAALAGGRAGGSGHGPRHHRRISGSRRRRPPRWLGRCRRALMCARWCLAIVLLFMALVLAMVGMSRNSGAVFRRSRDHCGRAVSGADPRAVLAADDGCGRGGRHADRFCSDRALHRRRPAFSGSDVRLDGRAVGCGALARSANSTI